MVIADVQTNMTEASMYTLLLVHRAGHREG